jgi:hypothetical protein
MHSGELRIAGGRGRITARPGMEDMPSETRLTKSLLQVLSETDRKVEGLYGHVGQLLKVILSLEIPLATTSKRLNSLDAAVQSLIQAHTKAACANPTPASQNILQRSKSSSGSVDSAPRLQLDCRLEEWVGRLENGVEKALSMLSSLEKSLLSVTNQSARHS